MRLALKCRAAWLAALNRSESVLPEICGALQDRRRLTDRFIAAANEEPLLPEVVRDDVRFHLATVTGAKNVLMKKEILRVHLIEWRQVSEAVVATIKKAG